MTVSLPPDDHDQGLEAPCLVGRAEAPSPGSHAAGSTPEGIDAALVAVLTRAQEAGFLGKGPVEDHIEHARVLSGAISAKARSFVDLGSGGGIPGLVVAAEHPDLAGVLLDGSERRGAFLAQAVADLGWTQRVEAAVGRAEQLGREEHRRGRADVVVARSFAAPAILAECAAPLLRVGGNVIVSDPPHATSSPSARWPENGLALVGLRVVAHEPGPPAYTVLEQVDACPDRFPRRVGIPAKRPLF